MRPFNLFSNQNSSLQSVQDVVVGVIRESVPTELIYILGSSHYQRRTETIFSSVSPAAHYFGDFFLLVVIKDGESRRMSEWEDILEQRCYQFARITIIAMEAASFIEKYNDGNIFVTSVHRSGIIFYDAGNIQLPEVTTIGIKQSRDGKREYTKTVHRVKEFLAGADLYIAREEGELATFMIHQCFEQSLKTIVLIGSGFVVDTHSIDRLLRYAGLVTYRLLEVFPPEQGRKLLEVLQKAYVGARYTYDFAPAFPHVLKLREKAQLVFNILVDTGKTVAFEAAEEVII
ncbi:HEPN domain-containing protein [Chitinophaga hostae]|uniref:HEPN domain-containing protein n=1 Tax=Chitinophaga hostae TaxID=2831022 RepID=A0ABS5IVU2_9BACT|nr:HEPN domain-containing protein [Chitinophaga hostae]MBS0027082.1 HEPN domain-containing protein [Chitinophaga hostae]